MAKWPGKNWVACRKNWSVWNGGSGPGSQFLFQATLPPGWAGAEIPEQKSFVLLMFLLSKIAHSAREGGQAAALGQSGLGKNWFQWTVETKLEKILINTLISISLLFY